MKSASVIKHSRLFAAADVLLQALESKEGVNSLVTMYVDEESQARLSSPGWAFTRNELVEAMSMLIRMGFARPEHRIR